MARCRNSLILDPEPNTFNQPQPDPYCRQATSQYVPESPASTRPISKPESTTGSFAVRDARGNTVNIAQRLLQYALVQEHQRIQRLILGRRGHIAVYRQVSQESTDLRRSHIARGPITVKANKPPHPVRVDLLCPYAVMANTDRIPHVGH
jgi:hypothetical protein